MTHFWYYALTSGAEFSSLHCLQPVEHHHNNSSARQIICLSEKKLCFLIVLGVSLYLITSKYNTM